MENSDFSLRKPSISIIVSSKENLKYYSNFSKTKQLPFNLRLFFNSSDGLRPLHTIELLDDEKNTILPLNHHIFLPESDYFVTLNEKEILTENDIVKFLEYKTDKQEKNNISQLKEIEVDQRKIIEDRVSVIIPTYKRPENLKNALESVVTQDYHDIEVIVVCDNGKYSEYNEETKEIVNSLKHVNSNCNIIFLEHSVNRNGAAARNTGILNSTGEYICFLDDDDIYLPGRLSKSIDKLKTTNKNVGAVYCGFIGWNSPENDLNRYKTGNLTLEILLLDSRKQYLHTNTLTYKRETILNINGFDESYRRHQDLEFNLRFFEVYIIEAIKEPLVKLRPEPTNIDNMAYSLSLMKIKQKFLNQFSYLIQTYNDNTIKSIYEIHWTEAKKFISDPTAATHEISENPKDGLLNILNYDKNIDKEKYNLLQNKYDILSKSISDLANTSIKTKPLQKLANYKSLLKTYYKQKKQ